MSDLFVKEKPYRLPWYIRFIRFTIGPIYHAVDDKIEPLSKHWYRSKAGLQDVIDANLRYEVKDLQKFLGWVESDYGLPEAFHGGSRYSFGNQEFPFYHIAESFEEINRLVATYKELESKKSKRGNFRWWRAQKQITEMEAIELKLAERLQKRVDEDNRRKALLEGLPKDTLTN